MGARGCRIVVGAVAAFLLLIAFALALAAIFTPQWQVAGLDQVHQIRFLGLYQSCTYGSRQGPYSPPQWICTFIPYNSGYGQPSFTMSGSPGGVIQPFIASANAEVDYTAYGGESWRLATLVLLVFAAFLGFIAFVAELIKVCLDSTKSMRLVKGTSCCSLVTLTLATLCCMIAMLVFAVNSQQNQHLYILELTAFAIFQLGQSFYIGIAALIIYFIALGVAIGGTALTCISARSDESGSYRRKPPQVIGKPINEGKVRPWKRLYEDSGANSGPTNPGIHERPKRLYEDSDEKPRSENSNLRSPAVLEPPLPTYTTTWTVPTIAAQQDRNTVNTSSWRAERAEIVQNSWVATELPSPKANGGDSVSSSRHNLVYSTTAI